MSKKYSRYTGADNRLYVLISRWCKPLIKEGKVEGFTPTTVELLDVHAEKLYEIQATEFDEKVAAGLLKQIIKNP